MIQNGAVACLIRVFSLKNAEVTESSLRTLKRIFMHQSVENQYQNEKKECFQQCIECLKNDKANTQVLEGALNLLLTLIKDPEVAKLCMNNQNLLLILDTMKQNPSSSKIQQQGWELLGNLNLSSDLIALLIENQILDILESSENIPIESIKMIVNILDKNPKLTEEQRLKLLSNVIKTLHQNKKYIENLPEQQQLEIKKYIANVLQKLVTLNDIRELKKNFDEESKNLVKNPNTETGMKIQEYIKQLEIICQVPELAQEVIKSGCFDNIIDISKRINNLKDFEGKICLQKAIVDFFGSTAYLNTNDLNKDQYRKRQVPMQFLGFAIAIIEQNLDTDLTISTLRAMKLLLNSNITVSNTDDKSKPLKRGTMINQIYQSAQFILEKLVEQVIAIIKNNSDNEELTIETIDFFSSLCRIFPELSDLIVKQGGSRSFISKLQDELTSKEVGLHTLKLIEILGTCSQKSLVLMNNQKAASAVLAFLSYNRNDRQVIKSCIPVLKLLDSVENSEFAKELDEDLQALLESLNLDDSKKQNLKDETETLEVLADLALLDKTVVFLVKNGQIPLICKKIQKIHEKNSSNLTDQGLIAQIEKYLFSAFSLLNRVLSNPINGPQLLQLMKECDLCKICINQLQNFPEQKQTAKECLQILSTLQNNKDEIQYLTKICENHNLPQIISKLQDSNQPDSELQMFSAEFLSLLSRHSDKIADQLVKNRYIDDLIENTKENLKDIEFDNQALVLVNQNMHSMQSMSEIKVVANKIIQCNGIPLGLSVLKKVSAIIKDTKNSKSNSLNDLRADLMNNSLNYLLNLSKQVEENANILLSTSNIKDLLTVLQNILEIPNNQNQVENLLLVIEQLIKSEQNLENFKSLDGLKYILSVMNKFPIHAQIQDIGGSILNQVAGPNLQKQLSEQMAELQFDINDQISIDLANQTIMFLANILSQPAPDDEQQVLEDNIKIIRALERLLIQALPNDTLLQNLILLAGRLCNQGEQTKQAMLHSKVPQILLEKVLFQENIQNQTKINTYDTLTSVIGGDSETLNMIDVNSGKQIGYTEEQKLENMSNLGEILLKNDCKVLKMIANIVVDIKDPNSFKVLQKKFGLLSRLCENSTEIQLKLNDLNVIDDVNEIFNETKIQNESSGINLAIQNFGNFLGQLANKQNGFEKLKETNLLNDIIETLNQIPINLQLVKTPELIKTLKEGLKFLQNVSSNQLDKTSLIDAQAHTCAQNILKQINELPSIILSENENLLDCLIQANKCLQKMTEDPELNIMLKNDKADDLYEMQLSNLINLVKFDEEVKELEVNEDAEIIGSAEMSQRAIESALFNMQQFCQNSSNLTGFAFLEPKSSSDHPLISKFVELTTICGQNPLIVTQSLQLVKKFLENSTSSQFKSQSAEIDRLKSHLDILKQLYPNIDLIQSLIPQILKSINEKEDEDSFNQLQNQRNKKRNSAFNKMQGLEILLNDPVILGQQLELITEFLASYLKTIKSGDNPSEDDNFNIVNILESCQNLQKHEQIAQKMQNMGIFSNIQELCSLKNLNKNVNIASLKALCLMTVTNKLNQFDSKNELLQLFQTTMKEYLNSKKVTSDNEQQCLLMINILGNLGRDKDCLKRICDLDNINMLKLILEQNIDNPKLVANVVDTLCKLMETDSQIQLLLKSGLMERTGMLIDIFIDDLQVLINLAILVAKTAVNENIREELGKQKVHEKLMNGLKIFEDSKILFTNVYLALANLSFSHSQNSKTIIESDFISDQMGITKKFLDCPDLVANMCVFYNSITFRNDEFKRILAEKQIIDILIMIFENYTLNYKEEYQNVLKKCLSTIGNLTFEVNNALKLIERNYLQIIENFFNQNKDAVQLIKISLDIFANLAQSEGKVGAQVVEKMYSSGVINIIIKLMQNNVLSAQILLSGVSALDYFCRNQQIKLQIIEGVDDFIPTIINIIKTQDWNNDLILVCLQIIYNLSSIQNNNDLIMHYKIHVNLVELLKTHSEDSQIINFILSILNMICVDKQRALQVFKCGFIDNACQIFNNPNNKIQTLTYILSLFSIISKNNVNASEDVCFKSIVRVCSLIESNMNDKKLIGLIVNYLDCILKTPNNIDVIIQNNAVLLLKDILAANDKEDLLITIFYCYNSIALSNEDNRLLLVKENISFFIKQSIENKGETKVTIEGRNTIYNINNIPKVEEFKKCEIEDISPEARNYMISGRTCKLHKKNGDRKQMQLALTPDLQSIFVRKINSQKTKQKYMIPIHMISEALWDFADKDKEKFESTYFAKGKGFFNKKPDPSFCFSIYGATSLEGKQQMHIECATKLERKTWAEYIQAVLKKSEKKN